MGIFSRMKRSISSKANNAIDKMTDPEKELELAISELEDNRKAAIKELIAYKATAKTMEQDIDKEQKRADEWEKRAMAAVKAGDDDLAKKAIIEHRRSLAEVVKIKADRDEAASYAIQLNKSRKTFDTKLQMLKLRKGTLATQMKAAKTGSPLGVDNSVFERMEEAERRIDEEAIEAEVFASMQGEDYDSQLGGAEFDQKLLAAGGDLSAPVDGSADPLEALKAKMAAEKKQKLLK